MSLEVQGCLRGAFGSKVTCLILTIATLAINVSVWVKPIFLHFFRLMLGFMGVTAFLSMWISNTATTAMMVPIVQAVLDQLLGNRKNVGAAVEMVKIQSRTVSVQQEYQQKTISIEEMADPNIPNKGTT